MFPPNTKHLSWSLRTNYRIGGVLQYGIVNFRASLFMLGEKSGTLGGTGNRTRDPSHMRLRLRPLSHGENLLI